MDEKEVALIVGAGSGLSASLARTFSDQGMKIALAARNTDKLTDIAGETDAKLICCDATNLEQVNNLNFRSTRCTQEWPLVLVGCRCCRQGPEF